MIFRNGMSVPAEREFHTMDHSDAPRRTLYLLSIWHVEREEARIWHGFIETAAEQRLDFTTLAELNRLLCEIGGWMDPPFSLDREVKSGQR